MRLSLVVMLAIGCTAGAGGDADAETGRSGWYFSGASRSCPELGDGPIRLES